LLLLVVAVFALFLIGPSLLDWSAQRERIAAEMTRILGRPVTIAGSLDVTMLPKPHMVAHDVRIGPAARPALMAAPNDLLVAESVDTTLSFGALLAGRIEVESITLTAPRVKLELPPAALGAAITAPARELPGWFSIRSVRVADGTVQWEDPATGRTVELDAVDAEIDLTADGGLAVAGAMTVGGTPLRVDSTIQPPSRLGAVSYQVSLDLAGAVSASLAGTAQPDGQVQGELSASAADLAGALATLGLAPGPPDPTAQPRAFTLRGTLRASGERVEIAQIGADLGATRISGLVGLSLGDDPTVDATLDLGRITLDSGSGGARDVLAALKAGLEAWPFAAGGTVDLTVPAIDTTGGLIRDTRLRASVAGSVVAIGDLTATLPGGTRLSLTGSVDTAAAEPKVELAVDASTDDLRTLLGWAGVDPIGIAVNRLRRAEAAFTLAGQPSGFTVSRLRFSLDGVAYKGGIAYASAGADRRRPGLGLRLEADRLDLDAFRMPGTLAWSDQLRDDAAFRAAVSAVLTGVDANVRIDLGTLVLDGRSWTDLVIDATLTDGQVAIRQAGAGVAGGRIDIAGSVKDLFALSGLDVSVAASFDDPAAALHGFLQESIGRIGTLGTVAIDGRLVGEPSALVVDLTAAVLGGTVQVGGTVDVGALDRPGDLAVRLISPDLPQLLRALDPAADIPGGLGRADLYTRVSRDGSGWRFTDIQGALGDTSVGGIVSVNDSTDRPLVDIDLRTTRLDVGTLLPRGWLAGGLPSIGPWPAVRIDPSFLGRVDGTLMITATAIAWGSWEITDATLSAGLADGKLTLQRLVGGLDGGRIGLSGALDVAARPALRFDLDIVDADLATLLPRLIGRGGLAGRADIGFDGTMAGQSIGELFSSLAGTGLIAVRDATAEGFDLVAAGDLLAEPGQPLAFLQALREALGRGTSHFDAINGTLGATAGRIDSRDLRLATPQALGTGSLSLDLSRWQMLAALGFAYHAHPGVPPVGMVVEGSPDAPVRRLDAQPLLNWVARRAAGLPTTPGPATPSPDEIPPAGDGQSAEGQPGG
jgi:uncharacterized protein involved in outer membrane biogenesis